MASASTGAHLNTTLDNPPTQYLAVAGGTIAYDDTGPGPLVICAPGIGDLRGEYRYLRPQLLQAGFRVVTLDLRGHGESSTGFGDLSASAGASDMLALIRDLDAGPAAIIGTSRSAGAAVRAAVKAPDLVSRLVLIGPFVRGEGGASFLSLLLKVLLARPWGAAFWSRYFTSLFPGRKPADFAAYRTRLIASVRERGRLEALRTMMTSADAEAVALDQVKSPVLVIMGARDRDFKNPAAEAESLAREVHGTVLMVDGAGHYPHAEMPEQVGPEIVRFLAQGAGADAA